LAEPPSPPESIVLLGRVAGAFGIQGWIKIQPYTAQPDGLLEYGSFLIAGESPPRRLEVEEADVHGRTVLCKLRGVDDRDKAAGLKGREIGVTRRELPASKPGEVYWMDLIGLRVVNTEGVALGTITRMIDNGAQSVMVVEEGPPAGRERLIPFVPVFVQEVSLDEQRVLVEWGADY